jgi:hypothetical protein
MKKPAQMRQVTSACFACRQTFSYPVLGNRTQRTYCSRDCSQQTREIRYGRRKDYGPRVRALREQNKKRR